MRATGVFSAGECGHDASPGGGRLRSCGAEGTAVLRRATGSRGRGSHGGGIGEKDDRGVRTRERRDNRHECGGVRGEREGRWSFSPGWGGGCGKSQKVCCGGAKR